MESSRAPAPRVVSTSCAGSTARRARSCSAAVLEARQRLPCPRGASQLSWTRRRMEVGGFVPALGAASRRPYPCVPASCSYWAQPPASCSY
eukprot:scaffold78179_cov29-Tisochrysis_lutea.AAC.1